MRRRSTTTRRALLQPLQAQFVFDGLPALTGFSGARPVLAPEQPLDQPLHVGRLAQAQQVAQGALLAHVDDVFVAVAAVPAHQRRGLVAELVEQPRHRRLGVARGVLLARAEHRVEHQAQVADPEGVQHVAGAARLVRVVADLGAFLAAVQRLDRGVQVQHPRPVQRCAHAGHQRTAHPRLAGRRQHRRQRAAHRVFADHATQAQGLGRHSVTANASDVRVALGAGQDAQHQRAQRVAWPRCVGAAVAQGAVLHPAVEHTGGGQEFGKEHDLSVRRGLGCLVPAHVHATTHRVGHHRVLTGLRKRGLLRFVSFTHRVSVPNLLKPSPVLKKTATPQGQLRS